MKVATIKKCEGCCKVHSGILNGKETLVCNVTNSEIVDLNNLNSDCPYKGMADQISEDCFNGLCPYCGEAISTDFLCNLNTLKFGDFKLTAHMKHEQCDMEWDVEIKCVEGEMTFEVIDIREGYQVYVKDVLKTLAFEPYSLILCPICFTSNVKLEKHYDPDSHNPDNQRKICIMNMSCESGHSWGIVTEYNTYYGKTRTSLSNIREKPINKPQI